MLLDEPTDGFSAEQVVRMGELLEELALPQVIVVSHEAELAGIADRTVRVVKTDGRSTLDAFGAGDPAPSPRAPAPVDAPPAPPPDARPGRRRGRRTS
jgi:energy-coupling factor transporter ATP-binding protein EcfA2